MLIQILIIADILVRLLSISSGETSLFLKMFFSLKFSSLYLKEFFSLKSWFQLLVIIWSSSRLVFTPSYTSSTGFIDRVELDGITLSETFLNHNFIIKIITLSCITLRVFYIYCLFAADDVFKYPLELTSLSELDQEFA